MIYKKPYVFLLAVIVVLMTATSASASNIILLEGFEGTCLAIPDENVISVWPSDEYATQGKKSLKMIYKKLAAGNKAFFKIEQEENWSDYDYILLDVNNLAEYNVQISLVLQIGADWAWYEAETIEINPGETLGVKFPLKEKVWKSADTGWNYNTSPDLKNIKGYALLVYPSNGSELPAGSIYFDNIRLASSVTFSNLEIMEEIKKVQNDSKFKVSGSAELEVVSQPKTRTIEAVTQPLGLANWYPTDKYELVKLQDENGQWVYAVKANLTPWSDELHYQFGESTDLSKIDAITLDVKVPNSNEMTLQVIVRCGVNWSWESKDYNLSPGWNRVTLKKEDYPAAQWKDVRAITFKSSVSEFYLANMQIIPLGEVAQEETYTDFIRTHEVKVTLDYQITDNWSASVTGIFSEPIIDFGLIEVKGQIGPAAIRTFFKGNAVDLGDPLTLFKAENYYENQTFGLDVFTPVNTFTVHGMVIAPVEDNTIFSEQAVFLTDIGYNPSDLTKVRAFAAFEETKKEKPDKVLGVVVDQGFMNGLKLTGELVTSLEEESFGWLFKGSMPVGIVTLEGQAYEIDSNLWRPYSDLDDLTSAYGKIHLKGDLKLFDESVSTGFFAQTWYKKDNSWKDLYGKLYCDWQINDKILLASLVEEKVYAKPSEGQSDYRLDSSKLSLKLTAALFETVNTSLLVWYTGVKDTSDYFKVPFYLGTVEYKPVNDLALFFEYALAKQSAEQHEYDQNCYIKITKEFNPGTLEFSYGKETLNEDGNAIENYETVEDYFTLKYSVNF